MSYSHPALGSVRMLLVGIKKKYVMPGVCNGEGESFVLLLQ